MEVKKIKEKLIITAAVTGAEVTKEDQPMLPISPNEIAEAAYEAYKVGASIVHVHARNDDGTSTQDKEIYKQIITKIKEKCDVIVQVSTGGAVGMSVEERMQPLLLAPEMATLTTVTVNFGDGVFMNSPEDIHTLANLMQKNQVQPEFEIFDVGMINNALQLIKNNIVTKHTHFDFVLGVPGGIPASIENIVHMKNLLPNGATWTVAGIGRHELSMAVHAILLGGHVRVGFEDNIYYEKGVLAKSNAQLVERVVRIAKEVGREVASPHEVRNILKMEKSD